MPDFIPRKDGLAVAWAANFAQRVASDAAGLGIQPDVAANLVTLQAAFAEALGVAQAPGTRTHPAIAGKDAARRAFEVVARNVASIIRGAAGRDRTTLIELGLLQGPGRDAPRRRVGKPNSAPAVSVRRVDGSRVCILLRNTDTPDRIGMNRDIVGAHLFTFVGAAPPATLREWRHHGGRSRAIATIDFGPLHDPGTQVWICAQWVSRRAEAGPQSPPVMAFLGYCGGATKAA